MDRPCNVVGHAVLELLKLQKLSLAQTGHVILNAWALWLHKPNWTSTYKQLLLISK